MPPTPCADLVVYYDAFNWNRDDDRPRAARQRIKFEANETEIVYGNDGTPLDFPSGAGVCVPSVPIELGNHRPRLFTRGRALHEVGTSDIIPNVPTPDSKRARAEVESNDGELENTGRPGGWKALACG